MENIFKVRMAVIERASFKKEDKRIRESCIERVTGKCNGCGKAANEVLPIIANPNEFGKILETEIKAIKNQGFCVLTTRITVAAVDS